MDGKGKKINKQKTNQKQNKKLKRGEKKKKTIKTGRRFSFTTKKIVHNRKTF